jgi:hypothetical protein
MSNSDAMSFRYPVPWVCVGKIVGHYSSDMVRRYVEAVKKATGHGRPAIIFHDWSEMTNYDRECRLVLTEWAERLRPDVAHHYLLVQSVMVRMGVATARMVLGISHLTAFNALNPAERALFERALENAKKPIAIEGDRQVP